MHKSVAEHSDLWEITGGNDESHIHVEPFY